MHFYNLLFALDTLQKSQCKDAFFSDIIRYLEDNHLPTKHQNSVNAEAEHYLLFNTLLFHFTVKSSKTVEHKMALCIPLVLSDGVFELYHLSLMTSHQGLTRTYYKWLSFRQYNYLLVMRCNHSRFIITDTHKKKSSEVAESLFQKLIRVHGTNIKEIYCDLDTAFKNEIVSTFFKTLGVTVKFCSIQSHQSNPPECVIQSISNIIIHYITKYSNLSFIMSNMATFCLNIFQ